VPVLVTESGRVLTEVGRWAMQQHLDEASKHVRPGGHAVVLLDNAGWHRTKKLNWPTNISPLFIPAGCPELNAAENVWQYLRQTYLSNRVFDTYDAVNTDSNLGLTRDHGGHPREREWHSKAGWVPQRGAVYVH
jgi:transposase